MKKLVSYSYGAICLVLALCSLAIFFHGNLFETCTPTICPDCFTQDLNPEINLQNQSMPDYRNIMRNLITQHVPQTNPKFIEILRKYYIEQPSKEPYHLDVPNRLEYSYGQTPFVDSRLNYIEHGFYVECGASTGEKASNTLFFEKVRKWNGLLIEADPSNYAKVKSKNRKAFTLNACLSPKPYPVLLTFNKGLQRGRVLHNKIGRKWVKDQGMQFDEIEVECFPLYSLMTALNRTTIDYFSLDVEGEELNVLMTVPFDKLYIKMLSVEYMHNPGGAKDIKRFVESKGYETLLQLTGRSDGGVNDLIFRRKDLSH